MTWPRATLRSSRAPLWRAAGAALLVAGALARPGHATAFEGAPRPSSASRSAFWHDVLHPGAVRARTLVRHGLRRYAQAEALATGTAGPRLPAVMERDRRTLLEAALRRFELAESLLPEDPEVQFWLGIAAVDLRGLVPEDETRGLDEAALAAFTRLRGLDADYEAERVALELGIVRTRRREFAAAAAEYARALELSFRPSASTHSNLAEVTMLAGELEDAVRSYERAEALAEAPEQRMLARFGLAVALDRLGDHRLALDRARAAVLEGQALELGPLGVLHAPGVFFEPASEIHYYEALGHEARVELGAGESGRRAAAESWRRYLDAAGPDSPWTARARENLSTLERAPSRPPAERRARRRPSGPP